MLDLSLIIQNPKAAVHCRTYQQAEQFCGCMERHHKRRTNGFMLKNWERYGEDTCYSPYFNHPVKKNMTYCHIDHYVSNGFVIVEFEDLLHCVAELDYEICGEPIEFLLG